MHTMCRAILKIVGRVRSICGAHLHNVWFRRKTWLHYRHQSTTQSAQTSATVLSQLPVLHREAALYMASLHAMDWMHLLFITRQYPVAHGPPTYPGLRYWISLSIKH
jgi:hypothetical protein